MKKRLAILIFILFQGLLFPLQTHSQQLEPRALTNLPRGLNFFAVSYAYAAGNTLVDPSLPLEDFKGRINSIILGYVRSVNFFGLSGKVDIILPFAGGDFEGVFEDESFTDAYTGFGDLRLRAYINLTGAPSLNASDYLNYTQKTVTGLGLQLIIPTGNYKPEQLPNLGSNRWSLRATYGASYSFQKWVLEGYVGVWLFSDNKQFLGDSKLSQSALWVFKADIIRTLNKKGMWLAFAVGYGYGAETFINDVRRDAIISQLRLGLNYALPLNKKHSLQFTVGSGIRFKQGADFDVFGVTYLYRWLDKKASKDFKKATD